MKKKGKHWFAAVVQALRCAAVLLGAAALLGASLPQAAAAEEETAGLFSALRRGEAKTQSLGTLPETLVPIGKTVGIKLFSDGVLVVGLSPVTTAAGSCDPARSCGLKAGDIITHINATEVDTIEAVRDILADSGGETLSITAVRDGEELALTTQAVKCSADGSYKLGAWIRDSMAGIGTVTFYDPISGTFGALGHGISDVDTAQLMPLERGGIMPATVTGVQKGQAGQPGQLKGSLDTKEDLGSLYANTQSGIFGALENPDALPLGQALPVAGRDEVQVGEVTILSNIAGDAVKEYRAEITRVYPQSSGETRNFLLKITDEELLEATGGIVQGMSGSPILQNGKLVGAVTHVLVNHPEQGYGISVENMWKAASVA